MRMTPRVTLILKRASSPLVEKIATTWRREFREREREREWMVTILHIAAGSIEEKKPGEKEDSWACKWKTESNLEVFFYDWSSAWRVFINIWKQVGLNAIQKEVLFLIGQFSKVSFRNLKKQKAFCGIEAREIQFLSNFSSIFEFGGFFELLQKVIMLAEVVN